MRPIEIDIATGTIRPIDAEGDEFYGLAWGTNGTAATMRRTCAEGPHRLTWVRHDGQRARSLNLKPTNEEKPFVNPWTFEESKQ